MSRSRRNWVLALILISAALYGVARLAVWYSVKDSLADLEDALAPVASVEYTNILSPVFGAFGVTGVRISPHGFDDAISIGSVLVHSRDPLEKFHLISARFRATRPVRANVSINRVRLALDGQLAAWMRRGAPAAAPADAASGACGGGHFSLADMKRMGYSELLASIRANYDLDRRDRSVNIHLELSVRDMFELMVAGTIPASSARQASDTRQVPKFSDLSITLNNQAWAARFNEYCAERLGVSAAEFIATRMAGIRARFTEAGFEPSEALLAGLEKFARGGAPVTVSVNPIDPMAPSAMAEFGGQPQDMIEMLGVAVQIDGQPIPELGKATRSATEAQPGAAPEAQPLDETYQVTPLAELPQHLKRPARVVTSSGQVHQGYVDSVTATAIIMTRHLAGGSATFSVPRDEVDRVLVLRP